jgi:predicted phage-related endonuclease
MTANTPDLARNSQRRDFIGGSDARIIMGGDEGALLRLWREKRGEVEPQDLDGWNETDILRNYPGLSHEDLAACLAYARDVLRSEKVYPSAA